MFSLKKKIEELDWQHENARAALDCYLRSILAMQEHAIELTPELTREHQIALRTLHRAIFDDPSPAALLKSIDCLAELLKKQKSTANSWKSEREEDLRSMIGTLAKAAEVMAFHNNVHSGQLQQFTTDLQKTARLPTLNLMRPKLERQVEDFKMVADTIRTENNSSVSMMEARLNEFQERLSRAELRACTDTLTGLLNRGEGEARLHSIIDAHLRPAILLIDLNGFKQINDSWGHLCGDQVLKSFSRNLEQLVRPTDMLCRWGGDEFLIVLQAGDIVTPERVQAIREKLRSRYKITVLGKNVEIEMSASVGFAQGQIGETVDELIASADQDMYCQKSSRAPGQIGLVPAK